MLCSVMRGYLQTDHLNYDTYLSPRFLYAEFAENIAQQF
jgi:hypothetical protein